MMGGGNTDRGWGRMTPIPGTVREQEVEGHRLQTRTYRWISGPSLQPYLGPHFPDGISLDFTCTTVGNERRWSPVLSGYEFFGRASVVGLAVRRSSQPLTADEVESHHVMRLLFQRSPRVVERLDYRIRNVKDLKVSARGAHHLIDIADPDNQKRGKERRIVINYLGELTEQGRIAAREAGVPGAERTDVSLAYGIDCASQQYAIDQCAICPEEFWTRLRLALFGTGPVDGTISQQLQDRIEDRFLQAIRSHLADPQVQFDTWFFDNFNSIVKQIANRKKPDGPIDREIVRQVLLDRVIESWNYVGVCVSRCMYAVKSAISPILTPSESNVFSALYLWNQYSRAIPLIMLQEYVPILRPTLAALLDRPTEEASWIRLQRALEIYSKILLAHRETDRTGWVPPKPPTSLNTDNPSMSSRAETLSRSKQDVAVATILESLPKCGCGKSDWEVKNIVDEASHFVDLAVHCQSCGADVPYRIDVAAARRAVPSRD